LRPDDLAIGCEQPTFSQDFKEGEEEEESTPKVWL
jgi:hypothetical protein